MKRRVVVTGLGAVTPMGVGAAALYERWLAGECGIVDGAGACTDFEPGELLSVKEVRRLDRFSQFALVAAAEALADAGWDGEIPYDPMRVGCILATGIGGIQTIENQHDVLRDRGPARMLPLGVSRPDMSMRPWRRSRRSSSQLQRQGRRSSWCRRRQRRARDRLWHADDLVRRDADAAVVGLAEAMSTMFGSASF